ncbi:tRNA (guanine9-N1)-methyltransferase protein [Dioscorea alata]|uniref:tRNA (Guanine9-N1)-methyltransferase protein n=2 Tax=Dioscorea alata TaxID=55571 RepID=A0ACB7VJG5_DIOAL|nr:tRNA (guanine9-N1)-methyltransferase protein [Dioscorea alata]KAH7674347.1 tRNA (guanine9-N1)-methyltransferase protein [Dioscorea alata]
MDEQATAGDVAGALPALSKSAKKRLMKQKRLEARKTERKAAEKERRRQNLELRRREWDEKLSAATEEDRARMVEERKGMRKERMGRRAEEREMRIQRLTRAKETGPKVVLDLEFSDLMSSGEVHSLVHQIMYCYAVNGKCPSPAHLWLTGCNGEIQAQLEKLPGFEKWMIEKESKSYIEAFHDHKESLVYLTADAETVLDELDPQKTYIIGGLVDRNRWKGITMKKATDQGIQSAKLPIGSYLKMSSSQVLTVNQVVEILLKFLETKEWRSAFFQVIPQRKRGEIDSKLEDNEFNESEVNDIQNQKEAIVDEDEDVDDDDNDDGVRDEAVAVEGVLMKKQRIGEATNADC